MRRLEVAGAFHTAAMAPAADRLCEAVAGVDVARAAAAARSSPTPTARSSPTDRALLDRLVAQLTGPVRFDLCLQRLARPRRDPVVELRPGGTLSGLAKRALPGVDVVALRTPADLAPVTA